MTTSIAKDEDYLLVNLQGKILYNIDRILSKLLDKSIYKYSYLKTHTTFLHPKYTNKSGLYYAIENLIQYAKTEDGVWFEGCWTKKEYHGIQDYTSALDILFYDEFIFLVSEDLIQFDFVEMLTDKQIWTNAELYFMKQNSSEMKSLYQAQTLKELKQIYYKLVKENHPDKTGKDNNIIRELTVLYSNLSKRFK